MTTLLLCFALWQDPGAWKTKSLTIVVQHSGAHRAVGTVIVALLQRTLAVRPSSVQVSLIGFDRDFQQLEGQRYLRKPEVLQTSTTDGDALGETAASLVFNGPSPVYDAVIKALQSDKPEKLLLFSNGVDNASQASFDDLMAAAGKANVPITSVYFASDPPSGGDTRLKKLSKTTGGRFIDVRLRDSWEQLLAALR
jgi:hypothetical protein